MKKRKANIIRKTTETNIKIELNLDGTGKARINTAIGFMDHMLVLWAKHGLFDLTLKAKGDLQVDYHHTVEDIGICLGTVLNKALGTKKGIRRFGSAVVPMDEALALVSLDISGRPYLCYDVKIKQKKIGKFSVDLIGEMFRAIVNKAGITLHIKSLSGKDPHHILEAVFKAFAKALTAAVSINPRIKDIPSTKGVL